MGVHNSHRRHPLMNSAIMRWTTQPTSRAWNRWRGLSAEQLRQRTLLSGALTKWRLPGVSNALHVWADSALAPTTITQVETLIPSAVAPLTRQLGQTEYKTQ